MKQFLMLLLLCGSALGATKDAVLDSNTAFYDGEGIRYVIPAPRHFKLVVEEAFADGYSMAFLPKLERYDSASIMIGVNIYKLGGTIIDSLIARDTVSLRSYYGQTVEIREVQALPTATGEAARTFYLKPVTGFVPNAAMAYFDGGAEVVIFELVLSDSVMRFKAEQLFADFVRNFKPSKKGTLGSR